MALTLLVKVLADASQLASEADKGAGKIQAFGKSIDTGMVVKAAAAAAVVGTVAVAIGDMTMAAAEDRAEQDKLALALENAGAATAGWQEKVDAAIASGQAKAFSDTEQRNALAALATATGSTEAAITDLALAQDLARASGVDLETAAKAVAKAEAGQDGALRKLMPGLAKGATAQDTLADASKRAAGQADLYAKSAKGMGETGGIAFDELSETIGEVFLPILDELLPALIPILQAFGQLVKAILPVLIPLVKVLGAVLGIVAKAMLAVVNAVVAAVKWIGNLIGKVSSLVSNLNPLKAVGDIVGGIFGRSAALASPAAAAAGFGASRAGVAGLASPSAGWSPVTIVTYGDPDLVESAVVRGLRRYDRTNGPAQVLPRWS